ncbi:hypothetical protein [Streptomyces gardneri]|uniref:S1 motif domain-containing protein n=1 Tax=Streptomyces gardneri TaxID=66892 RepID=A0A4Y3RI80_9ACTN|nr:hypothetical protein SGA01_26740 [Streptomyces gardneri]GHH16691.1 hypothetical protein GCM10017674_66870 [Streptomyces gardneri]
MPFLDRIGPPATPALPRLEAELAHTRRRTGIALDEDLHHTCRTLNSRLSCIILSGTVAAIERFGVFVTLDDGPAHPLFPGVGFIVIPELSWRHIP